MGLRRALRAAQEEAACELGSAPRARALAEGALAYSRLEQLGPQQARMPQASMQPERARLEAAQPVQSQRARARLRRVQAQEQMLPELEAAQPAQPQREQARVQLRPERALLEAAQPVQPRRAQARLPQVQVQALSRPEPLLRQQAVAVAASGSLPAAAG